MEYLTEDHLKFLLHKEWLVRTDNNKSIPYLIKFYSSTVDQYCCLMITDTKQVWGEVLTSKQFARRWRDCNPTLAPPSTVTDEEEDEWRSELLNLLSNVHSLGGITDIVFEVVDSRNADFAFELGSDEFKWRWETYSLGPKVSADVLSMHLIMPLVSVTHLSFSSADPVGGIPEGDLEKAVDKIGRTARRTVDTHVKHAISRPRVATTLRRMTAMFNFLPDLPPITSDVQTPELTPPTVRQKSRAPSKAPHHTDSITPDPSAAVSARAPPEPSKSAAQDLAIDVPWKKAAPEDSETEQSSGEELGASTKPQPEISSGSKPPSRKESPGSGDRAPSARSSQSSATKASKAAEATTSSDAGPSASPARPAKKAKRVQESSSSDDEDSEAGRKRRIAQAKGSSTRGAKQPLKRGGRRF